MQKWTSCFLLVVVLAGCDAVVENALTESQADEVVVALHTRGIGATKRAAEGVSNEGKYNVIVGSGDVGEALSVLHAAGLPRQIDPGLNDVFGTSGLVPTATEERARFLAALSGELSSTIERIDGVLDARVHLAIPDKRALLLDEAPSTPKASVLVKHRSGTVNAETIQRLVAGAVEDMAPDDVAVVSVPTKVTPVASAGLVRVGPVSVTRGSERVLKAILVGIAVGFMFVGGLLSWMLQRSRRAG